MPIIKAETATGEVAFEANSGTKLVLCLEDNGVDILHRCGGNARCTTCRVEILDGDAGPIGDAEAAVMANKPDMTERMRLSCQVTVTDNLQVKVIRQSSVEGLDAGPRPQDQF